MYKLTDQNPDETDKTQDSGIDKYYALKLFQGQNIGDIQKVIPLSPIKRVMAFRYPTVINDEQSTSYFNLKAPVWQSWKDKKIYIGFKEEQHCSAARAMLELCDYVVTNHRKNVIAKSKSKKNASNIKPENWKPDSVIYQLIGIHNGKPGVIPVKNETYDPSKFNKDRRSLKPEEGLVHMTKNSKTNFHPVPRFISKIKFGPARNSVKKGPKGHYLVWPCSAELAEGFDEMIPSNYKGQYMTVIPEQVELAQWYLKDGAREGYPEPALRHWPKDDLILTFVPFSPDKQPIEIDLSDHPDWTTDLARSLHEFDPNGYYLWDHADQKFLLGGAYYDIGGIEITTENGIVYKTKSDRKWIEPDDVGELIIDKGVVKKKVILSKNQDAFVEVKWHRGKFYERRLNLDCIDENGNNIFGSEASIEEWKKKANELGIPYLGGADDPEPFADFELEADVRKILVEKYSEDSNSYSRDDDDENEKKYTHSDDDGEAADL
jgi:hypothetical protein